MALMCIYIYINQTLKYLVGKWELKCCLLSITCSNKALKAINQAVVNEEKDHTDINYNLYQKVLKMQTKGKQLLMRHIGCLTPQIHLNEITLTI